MHTQEHSQTLWAVSEWTLLKELAYLYAGLANKSTANRARALPRHKERVGYLLWFNLVCQPPGWGYSYFCRHSSWKTLY